MVYVIIKWVYIILHIGCDALLLNPKYQPFKKDSLLSEEHFEKNIPEYILRKDNLDSEEVFAINRYEEHLKKDVKYHYHEFVEICYISAGSGYHVVNGNEHKVSKGDLFIINYDMWHGFYRENPDSPLITYNILFTPDFLDDKLVDFSDFSSFPSSFLFKGIWEDTIANADVHLDSAEQEKFDALIGDIYLEYTTRPKGYLNMVRAYIIELIIRIVRIISNRHTSTTPAYNNVIMESAMKYLHENYVGNINLDILARKSFFSKNYFCKVFKNYTGMNVYEFVHKLRIERACKMLKSTDERVVDIALEVGYSDYKSFSTNFKKITGITPHEYRKKL